MQLRRVEIIKYRNFKNLVIDFEKSDFPNVFSIASKNGGGKSTLLQFIFILLSCFMDKNKHKYIKNLLKEFSDSDTANNIELVTFEIDDNSKVYHLDFTITSPNWNDIDFNLYLDVKDLHQEIEINRIKERKYNKIFALQSVLTEFNRITPVFKNNFRDVENIFVELGLGGLYNNLRIEDNQHKVVKDYQKLINQALSNHSIEPNNINDLELVYEESKNNLSLLKDNLDKKNIRYINHLNNTSILLLKTDMSLEGLTQLSNSVFFTAPNTQVYHFLEPRDKLEVFDSLTSYSSVLDNLKKSLDNFYTYDFASTDIISKSFQKASDEDLKSKRKTGTYGTKYDELTNELKDFLDDKEVIENEDGNQIIFRLKSSKKELFPEDLSHGELKKLGIYIWLKYIVEDNSIVLMDEVDIALHPKWQYELVDDLTQWSKGSQFLLATHSPQILSSTYYKNIIKLDNGKVTRYRQPPIDRDINAIIVEIMEAPDFPEDLLNLHKEYRKLVNNRKHKSDEGKALRAEILEYESENSSFFQDINMDLELL
ncbi:MAG: AAA family ATPase [Sulfurovum sp.]|nr:AAA family ATPase [Sulfurovum sp.]